MWPSSQNSRAAARIRSTPPSRLTRVGVSNPIDDLARNGQELVVQPVRHLEGREVLAALAPPLHGGQRLGELADQPHEVVLAEHGDVKSV